MLEHTLKSGAILSLQLADFDDSANLLDAILKEAIGVDIEGLDFETLFKENGLTAIKDVIFKVISSKLVKDALWKCLTYCKYQAVGEAAGVKIVKATFNDPIAREDFFPVAGEVIQFNLRPFFKNLTLPSSIPGKPEASDATPASATG